MSKVALQIVNGNTQINLDSSFKKVGINAKGENIYTKENTLVLAKNTGSAMCLRVIARWYKPINDKGIAMYRDRKNSILYGLINYFTGEILQKPFADKIKKSENKDILIFQKKKNGSYGLYNLKTNKLKQPFSDLIVFHKFSLSYFSSKNKLLGLMDFDFKDILKPFAKSMSNFDKDGIAKCIDANGCYKFINEKGEFFEIK